MKLKIYIFRVPLFILHVLKIGLVVDSKILEIKKKLMNEIATDKKKRSYLFLNH